jgi:hypothetical protein
MTRKLTKYPQKIPTSSIARPSKIYPNWYFCIENIPSGNPAWKMQRGQKMRKNDFDKKLEKG